MKFYKLSLFLLLTLALSSCIGEDINADFVEPRLSIDNPVAQIELGTNYQFKASYFNNVGVIENTSISWSSSNPSSLSIATDGLASALSLGNTEVQASTTVNGNVVTMSIPVSVVTDVVIVEPDEKSGTIASTSSYLLKGDFILKEVTAGNADLTLSLLENYEASTSLPGLYVYLTNNPNSIANAYEIGPVETFIGAHQYDVDGVAINDYNYLLYWCKPFGIKVGGGDIN